MLFCDVGTFFKHFFQASQMLSLGRSSSKPFLRLDGSTPCILGKSILQYNPNSGNELCNKFTTISPCMFEKGRGERLHNILCDIFYLCIFQISGLMLTELI